MSNTSDVILKILANAGVKSIYGVSGDTIFPLLDAISRQDRIKYYSAASESGAAFMASNEARVSGRLTVCTATSGPGTANLVSGLADAYFDSAPVLALTGQVSASKLGTNTKQYFSHDNLIKTFAAFSQTAANPQALVPALLEAVYTSISQKTVAHLSIPKDVLSAPLEEPGDLPEVAQSSAARVNVSYEELNSALGILNNSKNRLIVYGMRDRDTAQTAALLSEKLGAALVLSQQARGTIPDNHPRVIGGIGEGYIPAILNYADCVLIIGEPFYEMKFLPAKVPLIQITNEINKLFYDRITYGLVGQQSLLLNLVSDHVTPVENNKWWSEEIKKERASRYQMIEGDTANNQTPIHPALLVSALNKTADNDAVLALDIGSFMHWFDRSFQAESQTVLISSEWRSMGAGLPAAIGAKIALPERQVVCLTGDGGMLMSMGELATAVRYDLAVTIIVFNNHGYILEKQKMQAEGFNPFGYELKALDFAHCAEACGARGIKVENPGKLDEVLAEALNYSQPVLVDVTVSDVSLPSVGKS